MDTIILILLAAIVLLLLINFFLSKRRQADPAFLLMQQQIDSLRQQVADSINSSASIINQQLSQITNQVNSQLSNINQQLQTTTGQIGTRLDNAARVVGEVKQNLGELSKATEKVFEVGKDISSLQEILRAPKLRGSLGELFLGDLLSQILPPTHYTLQYKFKSGETVDAIIHLGQGLVPIDAKFPLENFKRIIESESEEEKRENRKRFNKDVKKHIDDIASKYILPDEGTFDFALLYIPAENVYYETIIKDESFGDDKSISSYALERRVIPVSPNSFFAYLQAIVLGLKGLRIEKSAQIIISHLQRLHGDFNRFKEDFEVMGRHITNLKGKYEEADRRLERFGDRLLNVGEHSPEAIEEEKETKRLL